MTVNEFFTASTSDEEKKADIELSLAIACHSSIRALDHIGDVMKRHGEKSTLGKLRLHRTKCASIIKNIISASIKEELKDDSQNKKKIVLIIDESTDISVAEDECMEELL